MISFGVRQSILIFEVKMELITPLRLKNLFSLILEIISKMAKADV